MLSLNVRRNKFGIIHLLPLLVVGALIVAVGDTARFACDEGYKCETTETYPDAMGVCVIN